MKAYLMIVLLSVNYLFAESIEVETKPDSARVYLQGAELSHHADLKLEKGKNTFKITGVSPSLLESSIRINTDKEIDIMSVSLKNETREHVVSREEKATQDSIKLIIQKILELNSEKSALKEELEMLNSNKSIGGSGGVSVQLIKDMADFFRQRIMEINSKQLKIDSQIEDLQEKKNILTEKLNELSVDSDGLKYFIEIVIFSEIKTRCDINFTYFTGEASWYPEYNVKAKSRDNKLEIYYKAKVRQNSGIDWNDIDITLSTGNPMISLNKPSLSTKFAFIEEKPKQLPVNGINNIVGLTSGVQGTGQGFSIRGARTSEPEIIVEGKAIQSTKNIGSITVEKSEAISKFQVSSGNLNIEFKPDVKYSIPNDNLFYSVNIQKKLVDAEFEYYCAPLKNKTAYLIAKVKGWEELNILPGNANIYYDNSYNGRTYINPATTDSILQITVAAEKDIIVERKQIKEYREGKFLSSKNEKTYGYEINLKNTKSREISIVIEDQLPVSNDEDIEIVLKEKSGAEFNEKTGILKWTEKLAPGGKSDKQIIYTITAPEYKNVIIN